MFAELETRIAGRNVLLLGVGNLQRGDTGMGSYLVKRLQKKVKIPLLGVKDVPESYISQIESSGADFLLVVSAFDFGAAPGEIALIEADDVKKFGAPPHSSGLPLLLKVLPKSKRPEALFVSVQPEITSGRTLSERAREALDGLEVLFARLFGNKEQL